MNLWIMDSALKQEKISKDDLSTLEKKIKLKN